MLTAVTQLPVQLAVDPTAAAEALKFFHWAYVKGGKMAEELDYIPLPDNVVALVEKEWSTQIKDANGKALFEAK